VKRTADESLVIEKKSKCKREKQRRTPSESVPRVFTDHQSVVCILVMMEERDKKPTRITSNEPKGARADTKSQNNTTNRGTTNRLLVARLRAARAALSLSGSLLLVLDGVEHLEEGGDGEGAAGGAAGVGGLGDGDLDVVVLARAALGLLAGGLLALELALGLGAVGGLDALVVAGELLADGRALGLGSLAGGVAAGGLADGLALGAALLLAGVLGAADGADGLLAVDGALGAGGLLTLHLALGALADGVADGRAGGVVALPLALGVALLGSHSHDDEESEDDERTHLW